VISAQVTMRMMRTMNRKQEINKKGKLINFYVCVNHRYKPEASKESSCSSEYKEEEGENGGITKVEKGGNKSFDVKSSNKVENASSENIKSR